MAFGWQRRFQKSLDRLGMTLESLQHIIRRDSFSYISDKDNIRHVWTSMEDAFHDSGQHSDTLSVLTNYEEALELFCRDFGCRDDSKLRDGYDWLAKSLRTCRAVLEERKKGARVELGGKKKAEVRKLFTKGLVKFFGSIPDALPAMRVTDEERVRQILDDRLGLGKDYEFNRQGDYASANRIADLNDAEFKSLVRLLKRRHHVRAKFGWHDFGAGKDKVRLLVVTRSGKKDMVYYIFRNQEKEKSDYERILRAGPDVHQFVPAN